jgi:hypothetical protein
MKVICIKQQSMQKVSEPLSPLSKDFDFRESEYAVWVVGCAAGSHQASRAAPAIGKTQKNL